MVRLFSKVAVLKSDEARLEALANAGDFADMDEKDPRSIARWAKKMGREIGEDLGPEFDEMVERMEAGEMPEEPGEEITHVGGEVY